MVALTFSDEEILNGTYVIFIFTFKLRKKKWGARTVAHKS